MRALYPILALLLAGAIFAGVASAIGFPSGLIYSGFVTGVLAMLILSAHLNSRNRHYDRSIYEDQGQMEGLHERRIRRDRGVRHTEAPATFPAGDVA
jgi:hypothetical protein